MSKMTEQEISEILHLPYGKLVELARTDLAKIISVAINIGINIGQNKITKNYNQAFKDYTKTLLEN